MNYTFLILFALGLLGVLLHNLMKMDEINKKNGGDFKLGNYIAIEKFSIMISLILVLISVMVSQEIKQLHDIGNWLGLSFVAIGYMSQSIIVKFSGKAEKILNDK
jgi:hypothetical protein